MNEHAGVLLSGGFLAAGALLVIQTAFYLLAKALTLSRQKYRLDMALDEKIPFVPWTGYLYLSAYLFWVIGLGIAIVFPAFYRMAAAHILGCFLCFLIYVAYPTRITPPPAPRGSKGAVVRLIRLIDSPPVNLFPSMHAMTSWLCFLVTLGAGSTGWAIASLVWALLIMVSTLTVKQHDIADIVAGVALAQVCWMLCGMSSWLPRMAQALFNWLLRLA